MSEVDFAWWNAEAERQAQVQGFARDTWGRIIKRAAEEVEAEERSQQS